jgi:NADH dehydrogenase/NADH:ubiquinone oxidoreductase subunit G
VFLLLNEKKYYLRNLKKISITIYQFCFDIGITLPCFCYHEKLTIAGNCRICLVEVKQAKNLVIACATPISNNLEIFTNTKRVIKSRQDILEFFLINHPLDCPICDKGGECDLQDMTNVFSSNRGRFYEIFKKAKTDIILNTFIKTTMSRCIYCLRCVRFIQELTNSYSLSTFGRGSNMSISIFSKNIINSELSGNIIDLCPVGALTSKPYSFKNRP